MFFVIESFKNKSGVGCLLNISFNLHGYPVVESPRSAMDVFINSGIDFLLIDDFLILKKDKRLS